MAFLHVMRMAYMCKLYVNKVHIYAQLNPQLINMFKNNNIVIQTIKTVRECRSYGKV